MRTHHNNRAGFQNAGDEDCTTSNSGLLVMRTNHNNGARPQVAIYGSVTTTIGSAGDEVARRGQLIGRSLL